MSFFSPAPHSASVRAVTPLRVLRIERSKYDDLVKEACPGAYKLACNVVACLADRLRRMDEWTARLLAEDALERRVPDPALRAKLKPDYLLGCKRVLLSSDYYPALTQPNVEVVTTPIREIVADGLVTEDGRHYRVDAIICGTGFDVADAGAPFPVTGTGGTDLDARWRSAGPQAYLGTSIAGFPNFFMMLGPNTGLGHNSMVYMIEAHIAYIASCVRLLAERGVRTMEVRAEVQDAFNERLQRAFRGTVWMSGCRSWYLSNSGRNTVLWPGFTFVFRRLTRRLRVADYRLIP